LGSLREPAANKGLYGVELNYKPSGSSKVRKDKAREVNPGELIPD
jgi:hypothetical protein